MSGPADDIITRISDTISLNARLGPSAQWRQFTVACRCQAGALWGGGGYGRAGPAQVPSGVHTAPSSRSSTTRFCQAAFSALRKALRGCAPDRAS
ncbi:hypothetical protein BCF44_13417 [Kutzneria buriramensis]|uniref:Uncharacterized protein n=1 Tax=Kutzneria buriramensis TaxID=1045776 RepID=A0A3E0GSW4_9PSEU|nr:hypothetical protein BCF44_13417 [Kutzneria buriramensis]